MVIEAGSSGQGDKPSVPQVPDTTQPDQAALEKRERRRAINRASQRRFYQKHRERLREQYQQNPEPARAAARRRYQQNPEPIRERSRNWYQQNRERALARMREYNRRKRQAKRQEETPVFPDPAAPPPAPESPAPDKPPGTG